MTEIAVGVVMFNRVKKLKNLLDSCNKTPIDKVYVADNGKIGQKKNELYNREFNFELEVFDLEFDAGVGACRKALSERPREEYLLILDSDMTIPANYEVMVEQLAERPLIGGIGGMLLEEGRIKTSATDLYEENGKLHKDIREQKEIEMVAGSPLVTFDFIPQVGVFRRDCITDYTWDEFYRTQREHIDFFVGHLRETEWEFAICPEVYFPHFPGGTGDYMAHRQSEEKISQSRTYFLEKWGYDAVDLKMSPWIDTYDVETGRIGGSTNLQKFKQMFSEGRRWIRQNI